MNSGYIAEDYEKMNLDDDDVFQSKYFMDLEISKEDLREAAQKIMEDPACGSVFRIKGFTQETDGSWTELNATHHAASDRSWTESYHRDRGTSGGRRNQKISGTR